MEAPAGSVAMAVGAGVGVDRTVGAVAIDPFATKDAIALSSNPPIRSFYPLHLQGQVK